MILPDLAFNTRSGGDGQQLFVVEDPKSLVMSGRAQSLSAHYRFTPGGDRLKSVLGDREEAETRRMFYVAVTRAKTDVVFVCSPAAFRKEGFFGCLAATFGFEKDSFDREWLAEPGRRVRSLSVGGAAIPVAFEKMEIRDVTRRSAARLRDRDLEESLRTGPIVDASIASPGTQAVLSVADAATARAGQKNLLAGVLLHRFLERWDGGEESEGLLRKLAIENAVGEPAIDLVRRRIAALRRSPTFQRLARAETIAREVPIRFIDENGTIVERRIDKLLREDGRELVVDYKSGSPNETRLAADRGQVQRYCRAVEAMTGRPCSGLLWYLDVDSDAAVEI